jgi:hypothetical protein
MRSSERLDIEKTWVVSHVYQDVVHLACVFLSLVVKVYLLMLQYGKNLLKFMVTWKILFIALCKLGFNIVTYL